MLLCGPAAFDLVSPVTDDCYIAFDIPEMRLHSVQRGRPVADDPSTEYQRDTENRADFGNGHILKADIEGQVQLPRSDLSVFKKPTTRNPVGVVVFPLCNALYIPFTVLAVMSFAGGVFVMLMFRQIVEALAFN